jgi:sugar phosphate isomerase/epimerase
MSHTSSINRRNFLARSAGVGAAITTGTRLLSAAEAEDDSKNFGRVRLGAPVFTQTDDPEQLAREHVALGYRAAYCPNIDINDRERIKAVRDAFDKHDVVLAEVGRWCNLMDSDETKRAENLKKVIEGLALADEVGARCCVDIAGSFNKDIWYGPHPDNITPRHFDLAVENARKIIDAVKPRRAKFTYEMMGWALPDSPGSYLAMLKAIDRKGFGVHLDPCNLVNSPKRFYENGLLINQCFDQLGEHIVSCHAKDLKWNVEMNIHFVEVPPGEGEIDYKTYLRRLSRLDNVPLMVEHCDKKGYERARRHLLDYGPKVGVQM